MGLKESGLRGSLRSVSTGVSAIPDNVVTNPDENDLDHFSGDLDLKITTDEPVFDTRAYHTDSGGGDQFSTSGLPNYPQRTDNHQFYQWTSETAQSRVWFWYDDGQDDGYQLRIGTGSCELYRVDSGSTTEIASFNGVSDQEWIRFLIEDTDDYEITITAFDTDDNEVAGTPVSVTDDNHTGGTDIGFGTQATGDQTPNLAWDSWTTE